MALKDELTKEVKKIFADLWETRDGEVVPEPEKVQLGNHAVTLDAVVLYADLADSTVMVDQQSWQKSAEIYKSYMRCAARIIKDSGGAITAYDGDRIMAVFIGSNKNTTAAKVGLKLNWAVQHIVNPAIRNQYGQNDYQISHVVGIDASQLQACRIGVRNDNDLVWVGPAANHAAKLSAISTSGSAVFLTERVYSMLHESAKIGGSPKQNMWTATKITSHGNQTLYKSTWIWSVDE